MIVRYPSLTIPSDQGALYFFLFFAFLACPHSLFIQTVLFVFGCIRICVLPTKSPCYYLTSDQRVTIHCFLTIQQTCIKSQGRQEV